MKSELAKLVEFQRRARRLHQSAEALFADMMDYFGEDGMLGGDNATDFADNVVDQASILCEAFERAIRLKKEA